MFRFRLYFLIVLMRGISNVNETIVTINQFD